MPPRAPVIAGICVLVCVSAVGGGCRRKAAQVPPPQTPIVPVSQPVERTVTDFADFTGRVSAVHSVDVRARVSGYLTQMPFKEGAEVKQGDLLFEIDPRPYEAQLAQATGQVNLYQTQLALAQANYARDLEVAKTPGAISAQQLDQDRAAIDEAEAAVKAFQASMEVYRLNLTFTKVASPIDGQVGRYFLTVGNLAIQDQTLLTTIVSLDPVYVYFDMDEGTLLRIRRAVNEGQVQPLASGNVPIYVGLQGDADFPHAGHVDFVNNQIDPNTGSIPVRGEFENPKPPNGIRVLVPGMFVRVRMPIGEPHPALLVIDRAIGSDQGLKYVYVVGADQKVEQRIVTTGPLESDGLRVISDGLKAEDWVIVGALQQVRPKMEIKTQATPMPTYAPEDGGASPSSGGSGASPAPEGAAKR